MPPIQHICVVPHVCHWPHFIQVHPRIPVAHPVHPTWLTVQLVILSGPPCSIGPVVLSGLHAWWSTIRDTGPIWEVGTIQASLAGTPPCGAACEWHMVWSSLHKNMYEELVEGCGASSGLDVTMGKQGVTWVSPEGVVVVQTIGKTYIRLLVSQKQIILPLF